jgi:thiol:disulfide interchange protein
MNCNVDHQKMDRNFCTQCGAPAGTPTYQAPVSNNFAGQNNVYNSQPTNGLAIAGFVLSMIGCGFPIGLILSAISLGQFSKNPNQKGKGLALAGLIIGAVTSFFLLIYFFAAAGLYY